MSNFNPGKAQQTQSTQQQSYTAPQTEQKEQKGFLAGNAFFGQSSNNPTISAVVDLLRNWAAQNHEDKLEIIPLAGNYGLRISGFAIAYPWASANTGENIYITHYVLFEDTLTDRATTYQQEIENRQVQVIVTPDDWITPDFLNRLDTLTGQFVKNRNYGIRKIGFNIVPREVSRRENESQVYINILSQAGEGIAHYIEYVLGENARDKNTIKDIMNGRYLSLNIDTSGIPAFDMLNQPVRNDFSLTITAKETKSDTQGGLFDAAVIPLTQTSGFVDVTFYDLTDAERMNAQYGQQFDPSAQYRRFVATGVITDIQTLRGIWEMDSIVNAFMSLMALTENRQWAALFQRRYSNSSGARLRDVGALALEVDPASGMIDTASTQYDEMKHVTTMNMLFRPRFEFAIDLPRQSCYGFFRQLLRGAEVLNSPYYKAFIRGLHDYTNGHFPLSFDQPILSLDNRPVLTGHYTGQSAMGSSRNDLRDWQDYLTVLTQVGQSDINTVRDFDAALAGMDNRPLEERTTAVVNIIERMAGDVAITGKADRYNINTVFLETLAMACKAANLSIQTRSLGVMNNVSNNRRTGDQLTSHVFQGTGGVFSNGFSQQGFGTGGHGGGMVLGFGLK